MMPIQVKTLACIHIVTEDPATKPELQKRLEFCPNLPTLPAVAVRIIELCNDPESDIGQIIKVLAQDPALAAKMLRTANSAIYGSRRRASNLRQALTTLGTDAAMTIALGFSLSTALRGQNKEGLDTNCFWRRSILAATAARAIGEKLGMASLEDLFLTALLQDIGMLVLDSMMPIEYGQLAAAAVDHEQLIIAEKRQFGEDHAAVGAWLLQRWRFPDHFVLGVSGSHRQTGERVAQDLIPITPCVALSGHIADIYLRDDDEKATHRAAHAAGKWLQLDDSALGDILESVGRTIPEVSQLFEVDLIDSQQVNAIIDSARELLIARNLRIIQKSSDLLDRAQWLEARTRILEEEGQRDVLTGLFNRRYLDRVLAKEFTDASQQGWPLSLGFIDLDHFKQINDEHGHQAGDMILAAVAELVRTQLRQSDVVARYGGEEFVVLLPGTPMESAHRLFQRMLEMLATNIHRAGNGVALKVTASIGLATHVQGADQYDTMHDLLRAADRALYAAKRNGRNKVVLSTEC